LGDTSDNIPGVPGIGEKTASKLIGQYGSIENLLAHTGELKGKLKETLETHREQALLSKRLATINCETPCDIDLEQLRISKMNDEAVKAICIEFEFNTIGKRLFGEAFNSGRGFVAESGKQNDPDRLKARKNWPWPTTAVRVNRRRPLYLPRRWRISRMNTEPSTRRTSARV